MAKNLVTLEALHYLEDNWLNREGLGDEEGHYEWIGEGIKIYEQFVQIDHGNPSYSVILSRLYLDWGRTEKMRRENEVRAQRILWNAVMLAPERPDAYYYLSFILANQCKWKTVLFYAKEALENGLPQDKRIKLFCCMAVAYARLGIHTKADSLFEQAVQLDQAKKHAWFIELYRDQLKVGNKEQVLMKTPDEERVAVSRDDYEQIRDKARDGECVVLDLSKDDNCFYGHADTVKLQRKEAEILGYLMDQLQHPCSQKEIKEAVWPDRKIGEVTVKKYVSTLRNKLAIALGRTDIQETVLVTNGRIYLWKLEMKQYVLR